MYIDTKEMKECFSIFNPKKFMRRFIEWMDGDPNQVHLGYFVALLGIIIIGLPFILFTSWLPIGAWLFWFFSCFKVGRSND